MHDPFYGISQDDPFMFVTIGNYKATVCSFIFYIKIERAMLNITLRESNPEIKGDHQIKKGSFATSWTGT